MEVTRFNEFLGITEAYQMPEKLLNVLLSDEKDDFLRSLSLSYDFTKDDFRDYFQTEHGDRDKLKQDYTPDCVCKLIGMLSDKTDSVLDVCAGTGALSLEQWNVSHNKTIYCEEFSARAAPILLCNFAIRNANAVILQKDVLKRQITVGYRLTRGTEYSDISIICADEIQQKFDLIISNPPYSMPWEPQKDERFDGYDLPPKSKSDLAFVLDIVSRLNDGGEAFIILPHGILFRGASEGKIRQKLIEDNLINAVIGLPDNMFMNTGIPVFILNIKKNKLDKSILFIDFSKQFEKRGKVNVMTDEHLKKLKAVFDLRADVDKQSHLADFDEIKNNNFCLNIPRYVDTYEPEPLPNIAECTADLIELDKSLRETKHKLAEMLGEIVGDQKYNEEIKPFVEYLAKW